MNVHRTTFVEPHIYISETRHTGGWAEIGVYIERVIPSAGDILITAITHPCAGARWIVHTTNASRDPRFRTKREAIAFALDIARQSHAYRRHKGEAL